MLPAERKFTQERKVGHRGCAGLGNVVALRRKWQETLQMIQPSKCTCPGVRGRQRCGLRWIPHQAKTSVVEPLGGRSPGSPGVAARWPARSVQDASAGRFGRKKKAPTVRRSRTRQVGSCCLARAKGQGRIGLENLEIAGLDIGSKLKGCRRSILQWIPHQARTSGGTTRVSVSNRRTPMRVHVYPRAND